MNKLYSLWFKFGWAVRNILTKELGDSTRSRTRVKPYESFNDSYHQRRFSSRYSSYSGNIYYSSDD